VGDERIVRETFEMLGIVDIIYLKDAATYEEIDDFYRLLKGLHTEAKKAQEETLFLIWYGGHGELV
jgi:hypothetical protein